MIYELWNNCIGDISKHFIRGKKKDIGVAIMIIDL